MAQISIRGIRLTTITIDQKGDEGNTKITSGYQLISNADKVLATQEVNGYSGLKVSPSPVTLKALEDFIKLFKNDVNMVLGLDTEV